MNEERQKKKNDEIAVVPNEMVRTVVYFWGWRVVDP